MIKVTATCEAEAVGSNPDSARTCAEQKDILKNFRETVETACKTDPTWCALSKTTLHRVETKTNEVCERERIAKDIARHEGEPLIVPWRSLNGRRRD